ncbi:unnamed protein product [Schistocephalus solidus]|uniref:C2H2-type domain-containing protein n=1 Tax=Schistocephalus solidus TaxID=70667 RepID=A0A183TNE7_SCHSO|nr:unnamed protein product [Schistocephalus solidus]
MKVTNTVDQHGQCPSPSNVPRCQRTFRARIDLIGHLRTQCNKHPTTSTSATSASYPTTMTNPNTDYHYIDAPQPTITDTFLAPPPLAPTKTTNTTCRTSATLVATSCHLLPPTPPPPPVRAMGTRY